MKSHIHAIGDGNTGGAQAVITSATHDHNHWLDASHNHTISDPWHSHGLYGRETEGGTGLRGNSDIAGTGNVNWNYSTAMDPAPTGITINSKELSLYVSAPLQGNVYNPNVSIVQRDHSHTIPANTASNNANAIENRPQNYTNRIWKRIA